MTEETKKRQNRALGNNCRKNGCSRSGWLRPDVHIIRLVKHIFSLSKHFNGIIKISIKPNYECVDMSYCFGRPAKMSTNEIFSFCLVVDVVVTRLARSQLIARTACAAATRPVFFSSSFILFYLFHAVNFVRYEIL